MASKPKKTPKKSNNKTKKQTAGQTKKKQKSKKNEEQMLVPFDNFLKVTEVLGKMLYPYCEVLLHDLTQPESSIVAIENSLTGRKVGDPTTNVGLERVKNKNFPDILQNYKNVLNDGRVLKSSSVAIRNEAGELIGSLSLNFDISTMKALNSTMETFLQSDPTASPVKEEFYSRSVDAIESYVDKFASEKAKTRERLNLTERKELIAQLKAQGLLNLKGAISLLAKVLGVSRATIYKDLEDH